MRHVSSLIQQFALRSGYALNKSYKPNMHLLVVAHAKRIDSPDCLRHHAGRPHEFVSFDEPGKTVSGNHPLQQIV